MTVIQIFQQGRTEAQKKATFAALAERLWTVCRVRPTDLIISVMANEPADWSFGLGRAQFLERDL